MYNQIYTNQNITIYTHISLLLAVDTKQGATSSTQPFIKHYFKGQVLINVRCHVRCAGAGARTTKVLISGQP